MYKVNNAKLFQGKIVSYEIENLESNERAEVRPSQLKDFCILRSFANAVYDGNQLLPCEGGFPVVKDMLSDDIRKEKMRMFVQSLASSEIRVAAYKERLRTPNCSPLEYYISGAGKIGLIEVCPGTESFNMNILDMFHFSNANVADCRTIHPSHGYPIRYKGWHVHGANAVASDMEYVFRIEASGHWDPSWLKNSPYSRMDIAYILTFKEDVNAIAFVGKNHDILHISLLNQ